MRNLESLCALLKRLNHEEKKLLFRLLGSNEDLSAKKSIQLTKLISYENEVNAYDIQKKIYGKAQPVAFRKLVDRLRNKVLDVIILDLRSNEKVNSERSSVTLDLKKKMIQSDMLSLRGLRDDADRLCKKIILKAENYELYDIANQALLIRQRFASIRKKTSEVNQIAKMAELYEHKHKSIVTCQVLYNTILNKITYASSKFVYLDDLKVTIEKIESELDHYKSNLVSYFLNILKTELYQANNDYYKASGYLEKLTALVQKKSVYSINRMGAVWLNISNNNVHLGEYDLAISYAKKANPFFQGNILNTTLVDEVIFYSYFYKGQYKEALDIASSLVHLSKANNTNLNVNKWKYYFAFVNFANGDFRTCIEILKSIDELRVGSEDWSINKRLLIIMSRIELQDFESADLNIVNLEKYIKRNAKTHAVRLRYIYIIRILVKLINSNYNFQLVSIHRRKYIDLIQSESSELKWHHKTAELISFANWFNGKVPASRLLVEN